MVHIPALLLSLCLGVGQAESKPIDPPTAASYESSYTPTPSAEPSPERKAALASTIAHRRAYKQRIQGNALRQRAVIAPIWAAKMAHSHYMATNFVACSEE